MEKQSLFLDPMTRLYKHMIKKSASEGFLGVTPRQIKPPWDTYADMFSSISQY